jgi:exosortase B
MRLPSTPGAWPRRTGTLLLLAAGLAVLYLPTYWDVAHTVWNTDEQGHGPLIVALCAWLMWQRLPALRALPDRSAPVPGGVLMALSLAAYVLGRSQAIHTVEMASQIGVLAAILLLFKGTAGLRPWWFPLLFLLFAVPLPNILVQTITMPLKSLVSACAEWLLHTTGYPVGRTGVMLSIGQYQLLVADACAGLNSLFTLEALGFLWMSLRQRSSALHTTLLAFAILPISFTANVVRVVVLVLVTFYFGDAAGRGFMHGFAGIVLFMVAVVLMMVADWLIGRAVRKAGR